MKGNLSLEKFCFKARAYVNNNSSTILTVIGAIGVVATAVMAVKATPKALQLIEEATDEKGEELTKLEVVKNAGPAYIPTIVMGASTIGCIFGANVLNKKHQAAIASAYALADNAYKEYRKKVTELYGEETDRKIRDAIILDHRKDIEVYTPGYGPIDTSGETRLFYDETSQRYFESTMEAVINAEYHFNRNYAMRGFAYLNEFYEFLGLEETEAGNALGWECMRLLEDYEASWVDFAHRRVPLEDGLECYVIETPIPPEILGDDY